MQNQVSNFQKNQSLVSSNGMESFAISLTKKCERLSTAMYLVTNFLSDIEPMKYRLRALSIDLIRDASLVRYGTASNEANVLEGIRANISETLSLLELAFIAGLASEMNFLILKREYVSVRDSIEIKKASRESSADTILGDNFFGSSFDSGPSTQGHTLRNLGQRSDLKEPAHRTRGLSSTFHTVTPTGVSIGHSKGQSNIKMSDRNPTPTPRTQGQSLRNVRPESLERLAIRDGSTLVVGQRSDLKEPTPHTPLSTFNFQLSTSVSRTARSTRILKLVKDNHEVSIKDIANHFPELSEKTIQRELVSFTESGVLKKSGERRWSRYSIA